MTTSTDPLVLVVDDYKDAREMYSEYLKASGFRVVEAGTGVEAVAKAHALQPNCILMDLSLPGIDGWEATRQLKSDGNTAHIPIVAITGHTSNWRPETLEPPAAHRLFSNPLCLTRWWPKCGVRWAAPVRSLADRCNVDG